jgi:hypothetical protein
MTTHLRLWLTLALLAFASPAFAQGMLGTYPLPAMVGTAAQDPLQAPNQKATVARVMAAHPEIDLTNEATRGRILDFIAAELGGKPWGRKARNKDGSNLNTDVLAFLRADGRFEMYDVISGGSGGATWIGPKKGPTKQGDNGWWAPALPVPADVEPDPDPIDPPPPPPPPPSSAATVDLQKQQLTLLFEIIAQLQNQSEQQEREAARLEAAIRDLKAEIANGIKVRF